MTNLELLAALFLELDQRIDNKLASARARSRRPHAIESKPGEPGKPGKDFDMAEHEATIKSWIYNNRLKFSDLTDEDRLALKGTPGRPGVSIKGDPGDPGAPGKDFDMAEHRETIQAWIKERALKFSDLTAEERRELRGKDGLDGKSFSMEEEADNIKHLLTEVFEEHRASLKLTFKDLSEEDIESLRGYPGKPGKNGRDFSFEDSREGITDILANVVAATKDDLKLKFSDLTEEDKKAITLKFTDLTEEQINSLKVKGNRGQRGKEGRDGKDFDMAEHEEAIKSWIVENKLKFKDLTPQERMALKGRNGVDGRKGLAGKDGQDGKDAPRVTDITLEDYGGKEFSFLFRFSDGSSIETSRLEIPKSKVVETYIVGGVGGGGGGGSGPGPGTELDVYWEGVLLGPASSMNFEGGFELDYNAGAVNIRTTPAEDPLIVRRYTCDTDVFVGAIVQLYPTVTPVVMSKWIPISIANPILYYEYGVQAGLVNPRIKSESMPFGIVVGLPDPGFCDIRYAGMSPAYYTDLQPNEDYFVDPDNPGLPISGLDIEARAGNYWKVRFGYPGAMDKFVISKGERTYVGV